MPALDIVCGICGCHLINGFFIFHTDAISKKTNNQTPSINKTEKPTANTFREIIIKSFMLLF